MNRTRVRFIIAKHYALYKHGGVRCQRGTRGILSSTECACTIHALAERSHRSCSYMSFSDSGLCWTPVAQALEANYDLVMVDARGHGFSDAPRRATPSCELASDLQGVIASAWSCTASDDRPLDGRGNHPCACWPVPRRARSNHSGRCWSAQRRRFSAPAGGGENPFRARLSRLQTKTRDELIAEMRASTEWPDAELEPWADAKLRFNLRAAQFPPTTGITWTELLPRITCPALLITADLDRGAIVRPEMATAMQQQMPQLHIAHILAPATASGVSSSTTTSRLSAPSWTPGRQPMGEAHARP